MLFKHPGFFIDVKSQFCFAVNDEFLKLTVKRIHY